MDLKPALVVTIPGHVVSVANERESRKQRDARVKEQRGTALVIALAALRTGRPELALPLTVVVTRASPYPLDSDNLATSAKAQRDGATDALKQYLKDRRARAPKNDSDGLRWLYEQQSCRGGEEHLRLALYPTGCVAQWLLRHLPTEPSALESWVVAHAPQLDALLVREVARG